MQYIKPFTYFVKKPKTGTTNVLMAIVCMLIPFIGQIVLLGYRAVVADALERDPEMKDHPDFVFDKFMDYLKRGLWPFLANLIVMLAVLVPGMIIAIVVGVTVSLQVDQLIGAAVSALIAFVFVMIALAFAWPMEIHAIKTQKFSPAAEIKFAIAFLRKIGFETLVSIFLYNMISQVLVLGGLLLCFVGIYPATAICSLAEQHLLTQLYLRYLEEGGEPIGDDKDFDYRDPAGPRQARAIYD